VLLAGIESILSAMEHSLGVLNIDVLIQGFQLLSNIFGRSVF